MLKYILYYSLFYNNLFVHDKRNPIIYHFTKRYLHYLLSYLKTHDLTIVTVESCMGGGFTNALTNITGASTVVQGGMVVYMTATKQDWLQIAPQLLTPPQLASPQLALALAAYGIQQLHGGVSISFTGWLNTPPVNTGLDKPTVYCAMRYQTTHHTFKLVLPSHYPRWLLKKIVIKRACYALITFLNTCSIKNNKRKVTNYLNDKLV